MLLESVRRSGQGRRGSIRQFLPGLRESEGLCGDEDSREFPHTHSRRKNSFMEMTEKMMHVCENYGNWFIYIRTTINPVVFVEFLRG
jgi:hypothetical protein